VRNNEDGAMEQIHAQTKEKELLLAHCFVLLSLFLHPITCEGKIEDKRACLLRRDECNNAFLNSWTRGIRQLPTRIFRIESLVKGKTIRI
jgi:hypothetical protein